MTLSSQGKTACVAAVFALALALFGGLLTDVGSWYRALRKPPWQPPDFLFGPVWTTLYVLLAFAATRAWMRAPTASDRQWLLVLFAVNGVVNVLWSALFFHYRRPDWALVEVAFLWASIVGLIAVTGRYSVVSSWLLVPYLAWVSFASFLNWTIVRLNAPFAPS